MVIANFYKCNDEYKTVTGLWQYDYGQVLRIQGLDLPPAVEIHFSIQQSGGESIPRIGVTKDGVTDAVIPDSLLENGDTDTDYPIYAFVYKSDAESGETTHRIKVAVKSRPKPEAWSGSGETTMGQIMEAINQIASGKADSMEYKDNILKLLSGEKEIARVTIKGGSGSGADAREIELQKGETSIQWRYAGDQEWTDLISLAEITGSDGKSAYKYAQEGGYTGTEGEFAVLVGKQIQQNKEDISQLSEEIESVSSSSVSAAESKVSAHNTATDSHNDIRILIDGLRTRLNALADSDDTTLDQMSEVVAYIKSNKSLIDAITTSKVSVSDIIDNLTTNISNKPLSAAQGVALKALIDAIVMPTKLSELENDSGYMTQPETAQVGQIFRVKSINADGTLVLETVDMPTGGGSLSDVQINGASIVNNGVANIPYANTYDKRSGIIKAPIQSYAGIRCNNGEVVAYAPSNAYISNRNGIGGANFCFINTANFDYAVKIAMCDGKGDTWTDTERIAALLRMGCTVDDNGFVKWTAQEVTA